MSQFLFGYAGLGSLESAAGAVGARGLAAFVHQAFTTSGTLRADGCSTPQES